MIVRHHVSRRDEESLLKSLRGMKAFKPEDRGNLQGVSIRQVEIAAVVRPADSFAMTDGLDLLTNP